MRPLRLFLFALLAGTVGNVSAQRFSFEPVAPADFVAVTADLVWSAERGFGYEPDAGPGTGGPVLFSIRLAEGSYRVTVLLGGEAASETTVKTESRRLMLERIPVAAGAVVERSFLVNVRTPALKPPEPNAPGGTTVVLNDRETGSFTWDDRLTLEFIGDRAAVRSVVVEPAPTAPTIYLVGDSTVTDQRFEPGASWGQMLPRFLRSDIVVANHAESGETLKSFLTGLRFAKVLETLKSGDWLLIQFAHNDQKKQWPQTYADAATTYRSYLRTYIAEARLRGANPVLVTSVQRRNFTADGKIRDTLEEYPEAVRAVAAETGTPVIDLERASIALYEVLGPELAPLAFSNGGRDATHHNNYGAYVLAHAVAQAFREQDLPLAQHLTEDFAPLDPRQPPDPRAFTLPASRQRSDVTPRGF